MTDSCSGEKCLHELDLNIHLYLTLNYVTASEHLKYSARNFMLFYVFVAFMGLNNNTIVAMQNIEFGSVSTDRYPDPAENASIEAIPILNIGIGMTLIERDEGTCVFCVCLCLSV